LVEGIPDYLRYFIYEPGKIGRINPNWKYTDPYRPAAHFLNYVTQKYDKDIVRKMNAALREGKYVALNESDPNVLSYLRIYKGHAVLVALNMSGEPQKVTFNLSQQHLPVSIL
jgi:glycosidase